MGEFIRIQTRNTKQKGKYGSITLFKTLYPHCFMSPYMRQSSRVRTRRFQFQVNSKYFLMVWERELGSTEV